MKRKTLFILIAVLTLIAAVLYTALTISQFSTGTLASTSDKIWVHDCLLTTEKQVSLDPAAEPFLLQVEAPLISDDHPIKRYISPVHFFVTLTSTQGSTILSASQLADSNLPFSIHDLHNIGTFWVPQKGEYTLKLTAYLPQSDCKNMKIESVAILLRQQATTNLGMMKQLLKIFYLFSIVLLIAISIYSTKKKGKHV